MDLPKVFNFSDKLLGFSEILELCLNLGIGFCTIKLYKNQSLKVNFKLTTQATLSSEEYLWVYILELCLNLGIGFCTIKLYKNQSLKVNFKLTTQATLSSEEYLWVYN